MEVATGCCQSKARYICSSPRSEHRRRENAWAGRLTHRPGPPRRRAVRSARRETTAPGRRPPARTARVPAESAARRPGLQVKKNSCRPRALPSRLPSSLLMATRMFLAARRRRKAHRSVLHGHLPVVKFLRGNLGYGSFFTCVAMSVTSTRSFWSGVSVLQGVQHHPGRRPRGLRGPPRPHSPRSSPR